MNSQNFESYVPVYDVVPDKWEDAREFLVEHLKKISNAVNVREIGWYLDEELLSGKAFIPGATVAGNPQQFRQVFRKVIDFGALPNTATKTVAHGISFTTRSTLTNLYGAATNPTTLEYIPLPYSSAVLTDNIELSADSTNIVVTTASNWATYTRCYVVIEYIQEL